MKFNSTLDKLKYTIHVSNFRFRLTETLFDRFISNILGYILRGIRFTGKNVTWNFRIERGGKRDRKRVPSATAEEGKVGGIVGACAQFSTVNKR